MVHYVVLLRAYTLILNKKNLSNKCKSKKLSIILINEQIDALS